MQHIGQKNVPMFYHEDVQPKNCEGMNQHKCVPRPIHYYEWSKDTKKWETKSKSYNVHGNAKFEDIKRFKHFSTKGNNTIGEKEDKYYSSQQGQDEIITLLSNYKMNGYFVDLASNDWRKLSNTLALEKYFNWTGICIEPLPGYHDGILQHRICDLVVNPVYSVTGQEVTFARKEVYSGIVAADQDNKNAGKSSLDLITVTLDNVLDHLNAPLHMDYLSLDVEGGELHVLEGFNFTKYTFNFMSVERPTPAVHKLLSKNDYWVFTTLPLRYRKSPHKGTMHNDGEYMNPPALGMFFGETLYIHKKNPNFINIMNEFYPHFYSWYKDPNTKLLTQRDFLCIPDWRKDPNAKINDDVPEAEKRNPMPRVVDNKWIVEKSK